jgi:hypothetical protein
MGSELSPSSLVDNISARATFSLDSVALREISRPAGENFEMTPRAVKST